MFVCTDVAILRQRLLGMPIEQLGFVVELSVKAIAEQEMERRGKTIQMLARNFPPITPRYSRRTLYWPLNFKTSVLKLATM